MSRLAIEALHAHEPRVAVGGARPPRPAVAFFVLRHRAVHVAEIAAISSAVNTPSMCKKPGVREEVAHLVGIVVETERAREIERRAVARR